MSTMGMGSVFLGVVAAWGAGGCNRVNPAFDGDSEALGTSRGATTAGAEITTATTVERPTTTTTDAVDSTDGRASGTTEDPPAGSSSSGDPVTCELDGDASIDINVFDVQGDPVPALSVSCDAELSTGLGMIWVDGNAIRMEPCASCMCPIGKNVAYTFELGDVMIPDLPVCGSVSAWEAGAAGSCSWGGVAVFPAANRAIPSFVASNTLTLPDPPILGGLQVGLEPVESCVIDHTCQGPEPGRYSLSFGQDRIVEVGMPKVVTIDFVAGVGYLVTNRMSSIDPSCRERVAWVAEMDG